MKCIIFDLDGVLVDLRDVHFQALNDALASFDPNYVIPKEEHLMIYDGLSTRRKLELLTQEKGLPRELYEKVWIKKQWNTEKMMCMLKRDERLCEVLKKLKEDGYILAVASNAIQKTVFNAITAIGVFEYIDFYLSNEDVKNPKPNPEMYFKCMIQAGVSARETLIIEDSKVGREGAISSGAHLLPVTDSTEVTYERIKEAMNGKQVKKWVDHKLNILIPLAGAGKRFSDAGYTFPKPLIEVNGKPMIQVVIENLNIDAHYIFVVQREQYEKFNLKYLFNLLVPNNTVVITDTLTEGAACTTLLAKEYINNDKPLLLANSDQYMEWESSEFMWTMQGEKVDGGILSFTATHPKWSFARLEGNKVVEVAEKKPISDNATVGVYYWQKGSDYVKYAEQMIKKDIRTNNEFYVCPVYNEAIQDGKYIKNYHIEKMWGLGTPEDLTNFNEQL